MEPEDIIDGLAAATALSVPFAVASCVTWGLIAIIVTVVWYSIVGLIAMKIRSQDF